MNSQKFFQFLLLFGTALVMLGTLLAFKQGDRALFGANHHSDLIAQNTNTYFGPNQKTPGNPKLVRVQVLVYDDPDPTGVKIVSADFDRTSVPLKPRDIYGFRGQGSFQKAPGKYTLKWVVEQSERTWPRNLDHEVEVTLDERDLWIQISISGNEAEIS